MRPCISNTSDKTLHRLTNGILGMMPKQTFSE